ncbi:hypothetical protein CEXT_680271 [Caerostris extrusa]|uniref:Uncharacterized protein n=1 Tax=Caerostris extrusa TaxID=172846 RepID=A0AAV4T3L2_CAEEX|nr:hypothetical protein CEXT_680271 [Caerostris extrusa]
MDASSDIREETLFPEKLKSINACAVRASLFISVIARDPCRNRGLFVVVIPPVCVSGLTHFHDSWAYIFFRPVNN